jgi:cap2 methyltransferase
VFDYHLQAQEFVNQKPAKFNTKSRLLKPDDPALPYTSTERNTSALHWGQRKLLMSEIEFLTLHGDKAQLVVYAGAAKGYHIPYLAAMFPTHHFHLYDPAEFAIAPTDRISIYNEKMTDKIAKRYGRQQKEDEGSLLFISDIRTVDNPAYPQGATEQQRQAIDISYAEAIAGDNQLQLQWSQLMRPAMSMVKFKLPYHDVDQKDYTMYPRGQIYLPVWGRPTTTETRLMYPDPSDLIAYPHKQYEDQMFYFNTNTLLSWYPYSAGAAPIGIDHCYSCRAELYILERYVKKTYSPQLTYSITQQLVKNLSERLSPHLSPQHYTLLDKTLRAVARESGDE